MSLESFWEQGKASEPQSKHRGEEGEPPIAWVQPPGSKQQPHLVDLPSTLGVWACVCTGDGF